MATYQIETDKGTYEVDTEDNAPAQPQKTLIPQMTEAEKTAHPVLAGLDQTANEIATIGYKGVNGLSLGILGNVLKSKGIQEPNLDNSAPENKSVLKLMGDVSSLGGAGKTIGAIGSKIGDISNATGLTNLVGKGVNKVGGAIGRVIDSFKGASSVDLKAQLAQRSVDIQKEKDILEGLFKQKAADITFKGKQVIPQISKGMSDAYGKGLEDIFTKLEDPIQAGGILIKNAPPITNTELVGKLEDLVTKSANDPLIVKSKAYQQTVSMLENFKNGLKSDSGLVDASGKIISSPAAEAVDIKDLIAQVRAVKATIKASTQAGAAPVTPTDYFATQFDKTIGGLLKDRVQGFKELQSSYAPMANTRKVAYKIFKPLSDEDSTSAFLTRIKNDNLRASDNKLLKFIQEGGQIGDKKIPGMGQFAPELKNIGGRLKTLKSGAEQKQLAADIAKKAADEGFRNKLFLWTLGGITGSTEVKKGAEFLIHH